MNAFANEYRAFAIADLFAASIIESTGVQVGEAVEGQRYYAYALANEIGEEVRTLLEADHDLVGAIEWLRERGAVLVSEDAQHGTYVVIDLERINGDPWSVT